MFYRHVRNNNQLFDADTHDIKNYSDGIIDYAEAKLMRIAIKECE